MDGLFDCLTDRLTVGKLEHIFLTVGFKELKSMAAPSMSLIAQFKKSLILTSTKP